MGKANAIWRANETVPCTLNRLLLPWNLSAGAEEAKEHSRVAAGVLGAAVAMRSQRCVFTALCKHSHQPSLLKLVTECSSAFVTAVWSMNRERPRQPAVGIWNISFSAARSCSYQDLPDLTQRGSDTCYPTASRSRFHFLSALCLLVMLQMLGRWWLAKR